MSAINLPSYFSAELFGNCQYQAPSFLKDLIPIAFLVFNMVRSLMFSLLNTAWISETAIGASASITLKISAARACFVIFFCTQYAVSLPAYFSGSISNHSNFREASIEKNPGYALPVSHFLLQPQGLYCPGYGTVLLNSVFY